MLAYNAALPNIQHNHWSLSDSEMMAEYCKGWYEAQDGQEGLFQGGLRSSLHLMYS